MFAHVQDFRLFRESPQHGIVEHTENAGEETRERAIANFVSSPHVGSIVVAQVSAATRFATIEALHVYLRAISPERPVPRSVRIGTLERAEFGTDVDEIPTRRTQSPSNENRCWLSVDYMLTKCWLAMSTRPPCGRDQ